MQQTIPFKQQEPKEPMSIKSILTYTLLTGLGITGAIIFTSKLINKKRANNSDAKSFQDGAPQTFAKQIKMALLNKGDWGVNKEALRTILAQIKSKAEMEKVRQEYLKQFGTSLYAAISSKLKLSEYNELLQIMEGKPEKVGQVPTSVQYLAWAKRLKAAFDIKYGLVPGTDEGAIKAVFIEVPTQKAFISIGTSYSKEYKSNLITALKSELETWEYPEYMRIIARKPKG